MCRADQQTEKREQDCPAFCLFYELEPVSAAAIILTDEINAASLKSDADKWRVMFQ